MSLHRLALIAIPTLFGSIACSASRPAQLPSPATSNALAASESDMPVLTTAVLTSSICAQLRGRFLPIGELPATDDIKPRGDEPAAGRFWVRGCDARFDGRQVTFSLDGLGWEWVQRSEWGFGLHGYVFFRATGSVTGQAIVAFDSTRQMAVLRFRSSGRPASTGSALGTVETRANAGGTALSILSLGFLGDYADGKARRTIDAKVTDAFAERLQDGFDVTYDLRAQQVDVVSAKAIVLPLHPFVDGRRWLVNERQILRRAPGGFHILGPFAPRPGTVDFIVRDGAIRYRAECEQNVVAWFDPASRGGAPRLPPPNHTQHGLAHVGATSARLGAQCPFYILVEAMTEAALVDVRVQAAADAYPSAGP